MIDAVLVIFDVPVEHGRIRLQADLVGEPGGIEPLVAVDLVVTNDVTDAVSENFSAAAGKRIDSGGFQLLQRFADGKLSPLRQISDLDHGERLQMHLRKALLQSRAEIKKILKWQIGVQS